MPNKPKLFLTLGGEKKKKKKEQEGKEIFAIE